MLKANITMNDGTELREVVLFTNRELGDSEMLSKAEAEEVLNSDNPSTVFFIGRYVQGDFISKKVSHYTLYDDSEDVKNRLHDFVKNISTIYDTNDTANFIYDHRHEILDLIK